MKRFILAAVCSLTIFIAGSYSQTIDHFAVPETSTIPGWNEISGDWMISNEMLIAPSVSSPSCILSASDVVCNGSSSVRITYGNTDQPQSAGLVARYLSSEKNIAAVVSDEAGKGYWSTLSFYSDGVLVKSITSNMGSDLIIKMIYQKSNVVVMVDIDRNGTWDLSFACTSENAEAGRSGLISSGECFMDDYQMEIASDKVNSRISRDVSKTAMVQSKQPLNLKAVNIESVENLEMQVYPNPASGMVQVDFIFSQSGSGQLELFDVSGRLISSQSVSLQSGNNSLNVDYSDQPEGMYYLVLQTGNLRAGQSLIISR